MKKHSKSQQSEYEKRRKTEKTFRRHTKSMKGCLKTRILACDKIFHLSDLCGKKNMLESDDTFQTRLNVSSDTSKYHVSNNRSTIESNENEHELPDKVNLADINGLLENYIHRNLAPPTKDYPKSWTKEMIQYYFEPNKKYQHFDYEKILSNIDSKPADWWINSADKSHLNFRKNKENHVRCGKCNQRGHVKKQCRKYIVCHVCGGFNHSYSKCPNTLCFTCGRTARKYLKNCHVCRKFLNTRTRCSVCNQIWHEERLCPSKWRKYLSVEESEKVVFHRNTRKFCYNCAQQGHFGFECSRILNSDYPPENPFKTSFCHNHNWKEMNCVHDHVIFLMEETSRLFQTVGGQQFLSDLSKRVNVRIEFFDGQQCYIKLTGDDEIVDYCKIELETMIINS